MGLIIHDGQNSINKAINNVYGKDIVLQQVCLIHHKRNVISKIEKKINKELLGNEVWKVYSSKTEEKTKEEFNKQHKKVEKNGNQ